MLSERKKEQIQQLFEKGENISDIARSVNIDRKTVRTHIDRYITPQNSVQPIQSETQEDITQKPQKSVQPPEIQRPSEEVLKKASELIEQEKTKVIQNEYLKNTILPQIEADYISKADHQTAIKQLEVIAKKKGIKEGKLLSFVICSSCNYGYSVCDGKKLAIEQLPLEEYHNHLLGFLNHIKVVCPECSQLQGLPPGFNSMLEEDLSKAWVSFNTERNRFFDYEKNAVFNLSQKGQKLDKREEEVVEREKNLDKKQKELIAFDSELKDIKMRQDVENQRFAGWESRLEEKESQLKREKKDIRQERKDLNITKEDLLEIREKASERKIHDRLKETEAIANYKNIKLKPIK